MTSAVFTITIEDTYSGIIPCHFCGERGHRIGISTTSAAECRPCGGTGQLYYRNTVPLSPETKP